MAKFEVKVEGIAIEWYSVEAKSEAEAIEKWATGELVGTDGHSFGPVSAELEFDQEDDDGEEDEYEDDPLHHGVYDD